MKKALKVLLALSALWSVGFIVGTAHACKNAQYTWKGFFKLASLKEWTLMLAAPMLVGGFLSLLVFFAAKGMSWSSKQPKWRHRKDWTDEDEKWWREVFGAKIYTAFTCCCLFIASIIVDIYNRPSASDRVTIGLLCGLVLCLVYYAALPFMPAWGRYLKKYRQEQDLRDRRRGIFLHAFARLLEEEVEAERRLRKERDEAEIQLLMDRLRAERSKPGPSEDASPKPVED